MPEEDVNPPSLNAGGRVRRAIRSNVVDRLVTAVGFAIPVVTWIRTGKSRQRLADVEVPNGILLPVLMFAWVGQRRRDRAFVELERSLRELGEALGERMRYTDRRAEQLLDLQASLERYASAADERDQHLLGLTASVERLNRWLVLLTVVLGVVGLAGIGIAVWAAV